VGLGPFTGIVMRLGFLSDAHGNPLGLTRCLAALKTLHVDAIYFLGDAVGYLPGEVEVLELLAAARATCILGNHDAMVLGLLPSLPGKEPAYRHLPALIRLGASGLDALRLWPHRLQIEVDNRKLLLVHGDPYNPLEAYCYPDSDLSRFADLPHDVVFCGHTHRPFVRYAGEVMVVNVGSCGLPRDQGDSPSFATYDTLTGQALVHRVRVAPHQTLAQFEPVNKEGIHPSVRSCLERQSFGPLVGQFVGGFES